MANLIPNSSQRWALTFGKREWWVCMKSVLLEMVSVFCNQCYCVLHFVKDSSVLAILVIAVYRPISPKVKELIPRNHFFLLSRCWMCLLSDLCTQYLEEHLYCWTPFTRKDWTVVKCFCWVWTVMAMKKRCSFLNVWMKWYMQLIWLPKQSPLPEKNQEI